MQRKLIVTGDGSHSIAIPEINVTYHSVHGAVRESKHVFIQAGLHNLLATQVFDVVRLLEVGFGTGLNALLTLIESEKLSQKIYYETIELFPLDMEEVRSTNYCAILQRSDLKKKFEQLHSCDWEKAIAIAPNFTFKKMKSNLSNLPTPGTNGTYELIYFDPFDPNAQPELWTEPIFKKMFSLLSRGGILTTYSSKGSVRRAMQAVGFNVEKIPGPRGKREITRAIKA